MNIWGVVLAAVGLLMLFWGTTKSEFFLYRLLVARNRSVWGDSVHRFHQLAGLAVIVFGILLACRVAGP